MAERRQTIEPSILLDRLSQLEGFNKIAWRYARVLQVTAGSTLKTPSKGKTMTSIDIANNYLRKINANNFETGRSAQQIAKAVGYERAAISRALNELTQRALVRQEQRGRQIRYFLPSTP